MRAATAGIALGLLLGAGCGGSNDTASEPLRDGVYSYEVGEQYLLDNGIGQDQAEEESGVHTVTLARGDFVDKWRTAQGKFGSCHGTYQPDGTRVTFRWTTGCWGDWEMRYRIDDNTVTWTDVKALPPYDSDEDQDVSEVFNGVPWTRIGNAPKEG